MKQKISAITVAIFMVLLLIAPPVMAADTRVPVIIRNTKELRAAINAQKDGQVFIIKPGEYALKKNCPYQGENWFFPIYKNNITIIGEGYPLFYGNQFADNNEWSSRNLITVFGDNVTLSGFIVMPKLSVYKAIEVLGKNAVLRNITTRPNSKTANFGDLSQEYIDFYTNEFGGSIFFNGDIGGASLQNVSINKAWLSMKEVISGSVSLSNVTINFRGCGFAPYANYGVMGGAEFLSTVEGLKIQVDNTIGSLQTQVIDRVPAKTVIELDDGAFYQTADLNKPLTLRGSSATSIITSGKNSVFTVTAEGVTIESIEFLKTDHKDQSIISVCANNFTATNNRFSGLYQIKSNVGTACAIECAADVYGISMMENAVNNVRYPAYFHTGAAGTAGRNYAHSTDGFVVEQGAFVSLQNNAFGTNSMDITIVRGPKTDPLSRFYEHTELLSKNNHDCSVQNKVTKKTTQGKSKDLQIVEMPVDSAADGFTAEITSSDDLEQIPETGDNDAATGSGSVLLFMLLFVFVLCGFNQRLYTLSDPGTKFWEKGDRSR